MNKRWIAAAIISLVSVTTYFEGEELVGYWDKHGKVATVCSGHTKTAVVGKRYTKKQCQELLRQDLREAADIVNKHVKIELPFNTFAAVTDFVFNVGEGNFVRSTLLKKLNRGDIEGACNELPKWVYAGGVKLKGLVKRREAERALCLDF